MTLRIEGLELDELVADPVSPVDGQVWFNTTLGRVRSRRAGVVVSLTDDEIHDLLDSLAHGIAESNYTEFVYSGSKLIRQTVWTDVSMTTKVRESLFTYTGAQLTSSATTQFDDAGSPKATLTTSYTYSGAKMISSTSVLT